MLRLQPRLHLKRPLDLLFGSLLAASIYSFASCPSRFGMSNSHQTQLAKGQGDIPRLHVGPPKQGQPTTSYWLDGANPLARTGANISFSHETVDIVVIGSGITGISFVHHLVQQLKSQPLGTSESLAIGGLKLTVLEARDFCSGATGRNGGHLITLPYDGFLSRSARTDEPPSSGDGMRNALLEMDTVRKLRSLIQSNGWEADVNFRSKVHTRLLSTPEKEKNDLEKYTAAKDAGVPWEGIERLSASETAEKYGARYPAVTIPASSIWPVKLVTKMYELAKSEAPSASVELNLHTHTPVEAVELFQYGADVLDPQTPPLWNVRTSRGTLKTRFVIYATNAWSSYLLPQFAMPLPQTEPSEQPTEKEKPRRPSWIAPYREQMVAIRANVPFSSLPKQGFAGGCMVHYWIPSPIYPLADTEEKALILLGGGEDPEDENIEFGVSDDSSMNPIILKSLHDVLPDIFPQFFKPGVEPEKEWSGIMAYTDTEDPMVGPVPSPGSDGRHFLPGQYISAGYSGHGMSRAYSCAEVLVQMVFQEMRGEPLSVPDWLPKSFSTLNP